MACCCRATGSSSRPRRCSGPGRAATRTPRRSLRRALRKKPGLALAHYYLGAILFRKDDIPGAERAYREADRLDPKDPRALSALCQVLAHAGRVNDVDAVKRSLSTRFPDKAASLAAECSPMQ